MFSPYANKNRRTSKGNQGVVQCYSPDAQGFGLKVLGIVQATIKISECIATPVKFLLFLQAKIFLNVKSN